ncbi:MAG: TonB-dependent receptor [Myxococcota bacterium]
MTQLGFLGEVTAYLEASFTNRESEIKFAEVPLAPFAFFGQTATYSKDNFYNPFDTDIVDWRRRMVEGNSRFESHDEDVFRILLGMRGEIDSGPLAGWSWDAHYIRGESEREQHFGDVYNLARVANAVGPTTGSPATGDLACVNDPANCVPLNVFGQGVVTGEMLDYITFTTNESFEAEQDIIEITFSQPDLFELPAGPVGFAIGYQFREESGTDTPDSQVAALGDAATGTPRQRTKGNFDVNAFYAEAIVPLLSDVPGAESLELELALRTADYNTFGHTTDPKIGIKWRPYSDLLVRGTYSTAFRAPNIGELFGGAGVSFPSLTDPCSGGNVGGSVCKDPRVPNAGFVPISTQVKERVGGSPGVTAEEADIFTLGLVFTPSFLSQLSISIDYYDYEIEDAITRVGSDFILKSCATTGAHCDKIQRFPDGNVLEINNRTTNVGGVDHSGYDFAIAYRGLDGPFGGLFDFRIDTTLVLEHDVIQADGSKINHDGFFRDEQDGHFADWKGILSIDYTNESFRFSWDTRFIDEVDEEFTDQGTGATLRRKMSERWYHDVQVGYDFETFGIQNTLLFGMDNVFDKDPPFSLDAFNDNADVRTFDTVGRFIYARIIASF